MSASKSPIPVPGEQAPQRQPLRLRLGENPGHDRLDGGWWPQSRDLAVELADLVDHFPSGAGRILRAVYSRPDWEAAGRRIPLARGGHLKIGSFPHDDTHLIQLVMWDRGMLELLVVPPAFSASQGEEALLAASTPRNTAAATAVLEAVVDSEAHDPADRWKDHGDAWWDPEPVAPSFRTAG